MIGYCKDCKHCLIVNAAEHYGLCMCFDEEIKNVEYHSCTSYAQDKNKEKEDD